MYIPILKNRTIEMGALKEMLNIGLSEETIPMIELVQEKTKSNAKLDTVQELVNLLSGSSQRIFVDIPRMQANASVCKPIREFLTKVSRYSAYRFETLKQISAIDNAIPVVSFRKGENVDLEYIANEVKKYHELFESVALRVSISLFENGLETVDKFGLTKHDYMILDLGNSSIDSNLVLHACNIINSAKQLINYKSIIVRSNRPDSFTNSSIHNGKLINTIDNSLLKKYFTIEYGAFDGYGDYVGLSSSLPIEGGRISPAGIFYSKDKNAFVGYKGRWKDLNEFPNFIAPSIVSSTFWEEYSERHHKKCPGCIKIVECEEKSKHRSQAAWKGITLLHYLYTVDKEL